MFNTYPYFRKLFPALVFAWLISACANPAVPVAPIASAVTLTVVTLPTQSDTPTSLPTEVSQSNTPTVEIPGTPFPPMAEATLVPVQTTEPSATPRVPPPPEDWVNQPVIPVVSQVAIAIYEQGLEMGRNPRAFSKIGDCQNVSSYFLSAFAYPATYNLGPYTDLQETIDWFQETGSFTRNSLAVKGGFNVAAVLSPLRSDPEECESGESPLACEIRVHNPSFAIISMETWWSGQPDAYEKYMRQLLDYTIAQGVVPILATKADNLEGGNQINVALAKLAWEYDIPLWNFWASVQAIPGKGLTRDGFHLTLGNYFYNDPSGTDTGWSMRNLTALQALDAVRRAVVQANP